MSFFSNVFGQAPKESDFDQKIQVKQQGKKFKGGDSVLAKVLQQEARDETAALIKTNNDLHAKQQELKRRQKGG